jgi:hypothetical protein
LLYLLQSHRLSSAASWIATKQLKSRPALLYGRANSVHEPPRAVYTGNPWLKREVMCVEKEVHLARQGLVQGMGGKPGPRAWLGTPGARVQGVLFTPWSRVLQGMRARGLGRGGSPSCPCWL